MTHEQADYRIHRSIANEIPVFRAFHKDQLGKPFPEETFTLHLPPDRATAYIELSWPADDVGIAAIKQMFFPNSRLTLDRYYTVSFEWYRTKLSKIDRAWFELAAQ